MNFKLIFKNQKLLEKALTHRSYLNEHQNKQLESNERLEFLGDAVLELIVSSHLYKKYPQFPEGKLTSLRSKLVQTKTLNLAAKKLKLGQQLKFSRGERKSGGENNPSILADAFEAIIGALYQDQGLEKTADFIKENLLKLVNKLPEKKLPQDYKSQFQEFIQAKGSHSPVYKMIKAFGPDNHKIFKVVVLVSGKVYGQGEGMSKQAAEQMAAKFALKKERRKSVKN